MAKYYILGDVETTGLSEQKERITEIALIKTDEDFNIISTYETLINPERTLSDYIIDLTGITEEMLENEDKYPVAIPKIKEWWYNGITSEDEIIFIAHNAKFDKKFINKGSQDILNEDLIDLTIDTVAIARELYPFWRNHKLDTCAKKLGVENNEHHRALNDTMVLLAIAKELIPEFIGEGLNPINFTKGR